MPDRDDEEQQERLWKRRRKPGTIDVGSLIKVKGEIREHWGVQKVHVMKLGKPCEAKLIKILLRIRISRRKHGRKESRSSDPHCRNRGNFPRPKYQNITVNRPKKT